MPWITPATFSADQVVDEDDLNAISGDLQYLYDELPTRATCWHDASIVTNGNAIAVTISAFQRYGYYAAQSAAANGDVFTQSVVLAAGTFTMFILGRANTDAGQIDWDLDGNTLATAQEWYAASSTPNTEKSVASVVVATAGRLVLTGTISGKHASSSGYNMYLTKIWFKQASDS